MWIPLRCLKTSGLNGTWPTVILTVTGGVVIIALMLVRRKPMPEPGRIAVIGLLFGGQSSQGDRANRLSQLD